MWPDLFGPGWYWGALTAAAAFGLFIALIWLSGDFHMPPNTSALLGRIWHEYKQGSLTRQAFERLRWGTTGEKLRVLRVRSRR